MRKLITKTVFNLQLNFWLEWNLLVDGNMDSEAYINVVHKVIGALGVRNTFETNRRYKIHSKLKIVMKDCCNVVSRLNMGCF